MGVKETKEPQRGRKIVVVGYAQGGGVSAALEAGICVGDRVLACNGVALHSIQELQQAIKVAKERSSDPNCTILDLMVIRSSDQLSRIEKQYVDGNITLAADGYTMQGCNLRPHDWAPTRTIGLLADVLHRCCPAEAFADAHIEALSAILRHPSSASAAAEPKKEAANSRSASQESSSGSDGKDEEEGGASGLPAWRVMTGILLDVENFVVTNSVANQKQHRKEKRDLLPVWLGDERMRFRWRHMVANANRYSSICVLATIFNLALNIPQLP
jgi:hypothetical protein